MKATLELVTWFSAALGLVVAVLHIRFLPRGCLRVGFEIAACGLGAVLGVAGIWALGAPLELWSAGMLALGTWAFSVSCLAGGPLS